jgi:hypothetical protein
MVLLEAPLREYEQATLTACRVRSETSITDLVGHNASSGDGWSKESVQHSG